MNFRVFFTEQMPASAKGSSPLQARETQRDLSA